MMSSNATNYRWTLRLQDLDMTIFEKLLLGLLHAAWLGAVSEIEDVALCLQHEDPCIQQKHVQGGHSLATHFAPFLEDDYVSLLHHLCD